MSSSILEEAAAGRAFIQPWTVEQYHWALENGFIEESHAFELLDGFIVRKNRAATGEDLMTVGDRHALVVQRLVRIATQFAAIGCHLRIQQPILLPPHDEPEPDISIAVGTEDDFANRKPGSSDVSCVIEVADSSLDRDLGPKLRMYARNGIGQYVVVDLANNIVYDHRKPKLERYAAVAPLRSGATLTVIVPERKSIEIPVERLLP